MRIVRPVTIGIGGGSGSGKSTVAAMLRERLQPLTVEVIGLDRFFKPPEQMPTYWSSLHGAPRPNFNRPESLDHEAMLAFCRNIAGPDVLLLEGHFALYFAPMRQLMDIKCFVEVEVEEMLRRRTERNLRNHYGGTAEEIFHYNRECVAPEYQRHILPTRAHADWIIPNSTTHTAARDAMIDRLCAEIRRRVNPCRRQVGPAGSGR